MNKQALAEELNQLLATETRSLARHLDEAKPYVTPKTYRAWAQVQRLSHTSAEHSQRLSALFEAIEQTPRAIPYPSEVANYHFLSLSALLPLLIREKRSQIEAFQRALQHAGGPDADLRLAAELTALLDENRAGLAVLEAFEQAHGCSAVAGSN